MRWLACVLATTCLATSFTAQDEELPETTRPFALPLGRDARTLAEKASDHARSQRWSEAIVALQSLLDEHRGEVLPELYRDSFSDHSWHEAHPGAAAWARRELFALPAKARLLYRERYGARAGRALELARSRKSRRALVEVSRRWPLSAAAVSAWWTLGDMELEQGHARAALISWSRAQEVMDFFEEEAAGASTRASKGAEARQRLALSLLANEEGENTDAAPPSLAEALRIQDPTLSRGPLPMADAEPWEVALDLEPFEKRSYHHGLLPVLAEERVFVNSTLRLFAVDAFTGELKWDAGPPQGWGQLKQRKKDELFRGLNKKQVLIAPAVGGRIALAALQIPYSEEANENWQGIEIRVAIPERRLFAFDAETGEELWNHAPELTWNATSGYFDWNGQGNFAQRMRIAGPPVLAGTRVLVPCYRMQGRIDYHVACYQLETGELLWSTNVVSGQRPRNMFGRARVEFAASPLVVAGERVIAQTELGAVAALDLMTGELLWESLYKQIPLPKTRSYTSPKREVKWRLAPPVVVDGVVVSTPSDSTELVTFDLDDGRVLSSNSQSSLLVDSRNSQFAFDLLLGADANTVYLGGRKIGAISKSGGLAAGGRFDRPGWSVAVGSERSSDMAARALLCRDSILVPLRDERVVIDRSNGLVIQGLGAPWSPEHYGNALVEKGFIITLSKDGLSGFFDWNALVARQRERQARQPDDASIALDTARLFARRAGSMYEDDDLFGAWQFLEDAREILEPLRKELVADDSVRLLTRTKDELFGVLRLQASVLEDQGRRASALTALSEARHLAPRRTALRDTLLQEERILRTSNLTAGRLEVLKRLEDSCGDLPLPPGEAIANLQPAAGIGLDVGTGRREIPVGLWVLFTRADLHVRTPDFGLALDDWHAVMARYGELEIAPGVSAGALARDEIHGVLLMPNGRNAYQRFERSAAELYAAALEADDPVRLEEVGRLYPHSRAALDAMRARLDWAFARDEAEIVASIVYERIEAAGGHDPEDRLLLLRLARVLGRSGNLDFERELLEELVRAEPDARSDLPAHEGKSLREVLALLTEETAPVPELVPQFDSTVIADRNGPFRGEYLFIGRVHPPTDPSESLPEEVHVYLVSKERIEAYSNLERGHPAWEFQVQEPVRGARACTVGTDRVLIGGMSSVWGLDASGTAQWLRSTGELPVQTLVSHGGLVLALVGTTDPERVLAFDAHSGIPLWTQHLGAEGHWTGPIFGDGKAVFFSQIFGRPARARIVDLYRGSTVTEIELGANPNNQLGFSAWIRAGNLIVPNFARFASGKSGVSAYDLNSGRQMWNIPLRETEEFWAVAYHGDDDYLVTLSDSPTSSGGIYALDAQVGSIRTIVPLGIGQEPLGLENRFRTELSTPYIFTLTETPGDREVPIRAIHLPYQVRWTWTLPLPFEDLYHGDMPLPAVSEECVAIAYVRKNPNGLRGEAMMVFMDKDTGRRQDTVFLDQDFSYASALELRGLGESLFVVGTGTAQRGLRLQILEKIR